MNRQPESRGYWSFTRIGRPVCWYDHRSKNTLSVADFEKAMHERKKIGFSEVITNDFVVSKQNDEQQKLR